MANGLPSNEVYAIHKDKKGYLWIGTDRGLCKFDGKTFITFTTKDGLCENSILEIKEDEKGRIWCRGYAGLFNIIDNDKVYSSKFNSAIEKLKIGYFLYQFEFDKSSNIYISTRTTGHIYKSLPPYNNLQVSDSIFNAPALYHIEKNKYLTSSPTAISQNVKAKVLYKDKKIQFKIPKYAYGPFCRNISTSKCLLFSLDKDLYSISLSEDVINFDKINDNKINNLRLPFKISSLQSISENLFLIGGFEGQLAIFDSETYKYRLLDKFPSSISSIYYENKSCWVTTLNSGIYHIPNINYEIFHSNEFQLISILPISADSLLVLNANSEIALISNKSKEIFRDNVNKKTLMYWQRFDHSQKEFLPLIGSYNYIIKRSNKKKIYLDLDYKHEWNQTEFIVPLGNYIYVSFYGGLRIYDQKGKEVNFIKKTVGRATCLFGHNDRLFGGTLKGAYELIKNEWIPIDTNVFFTHRIAAIDKIGKDTLVVTTQDNGIGIYNLNTKKLSIFNKNVGLDKHVVQHAYADDDGKIWIATKQSIHLLKITPDQNPILLDVVDLAIGDLSIKEIRVVDKLVYIVAGNQILTIPENLIIFNSSSYPLLLNEVKVNDSSRSINDITSKQLSSEENTLLFKYQLVNYDQKNNVEYRYQLNNSQWVSTSNNELQLVSLPSQKYSLKIEGRLKNGVWSKPVVINFDISTPFFKSWWFIVLIIIGSLLLVYAFLAYYFKRKLRKQLREFEITQELESARLIASKSQMNPHFIFNALSSIQNFILKSEKIEAYQYLTDFSILIRNYLEYSNKDYIKLDKELELLQTYIKIEQLRIPFEFVMNLSKNIKPSEEYIFSLLIQPCLENAIWHGLNHKMGHKILKLDVVKNEEEFEVNITDNGIGRKQSAIINANRISKPSSVAMNNMSTRINSLRLLYKNNIFVDIIDNYDAEGKAIGTSVILKYKIIHEQN